MEDIIIELPRKTFYFTHSNIKCTYLRTMMKQYLQKKEKWHQRWINSGCPRGGTIHDRSEEYDHVYEQLQQVADKSGCTFLWNNKQ